MRQKSTRNYMNNYILSFIFLFSTLFAQAQETQQLSMESAIQIALENNYSIRLAKNEKEIATYTKKAGVSLLMPNVDAVGNYSRSINDTRQQFLTGGTNERKNALTTNSGAALELNWVLFDGFKMFASYDKLKELERMGETNARSMILQTIANVMAGYYDISRQQQQIDATRNTLTISKQRLDISENRYNVGSGSKLEMLTAKVDYNADLSALLKQEENLKQAKINLNLLLARDAGMTYTTIDTIHVDEQLKIEDIKTKTRTQNPDLIYAESVKKVSRMTLKETKADRLPELRLNSGYSYSNTTSEAGLLIENRNIGFNYGLTARMNLFNGTLQNKKEKIARLEYESASLSFEQIQQQIDANLQTIFNSYINNIELLKIEEENIEVAKQNMDISAEKFKLGGIAAIELREAQKNYLDATIRYVNSLYDAKIAEINLKELAGEPANQ